MTITRAPGNPGRSKYVEFNGVVQMVATAADLKGQAEQALATIDALLVEAGSHKSRLLSATVFITDMERKEDMQEAWMAWVDPEARPLRACVEVGLAGGCLIEIVAQAAK
ncbi:MAG: RidA family protein [Rhodospirillales bacterium]|nr:RidA family protein [Rhodospirillales bacterium]MDP7650575.1 RidA family protein [Rhodospirillales bacterium]